MWKVVRLFRSRDLSLLKFEEEQPHMGGQWLLRKELRRIAECGANAA